jgi:hypothetical protein
VVQQGEALAAVGGVSGGSCGECGAILVGIVRGRERDEGRKRGGEQTGVDHGRGFFTVRKGHVLGYQS